MNVGSTLPSAVPKQKPPIDRARFFYSGAAALLLALMFFGFQQFYLHGRAYPGRPLTPPIRSLLIVHGTAMTLWMLLLLVQPLLIVNSKYRVHMALGKIGAVLAACIFVLGLRVGIEATRVTPPEVKIWGYTARQFMTVPIFSIVIFAGFVAAGILNRRQPEVHRPMMLLATLAAMPAAVSRIDPLNALYSHTIWETIFGPFFMTLVVGAVLLAVKWGLTRSFDRYYAMGYAGLVVASAGIMKLAPTQVWDGVAGFLLR